MINHNILNFTQISKELILKSDNYNELLFWRRNVQMNSFFGKQGKILFLAFTVIFVLMAIGFERSYAKEFLLDQNMNSIIESQNNMQFTKESLIVDINKENIKPEIQIDENEAIKIKNNNKIKLQSYYDVEGLILNTQGTLTENNPLDLYFFSPTSNKILISRILSENENYTLRLYVIDYENGLAYPTQISTLPQELMLVNLPAGDYALGVISEGTLGDSYTIQMNASNPANFSEAIFVTQDLTRFVAKYSDGSLYSNGKYILNVNGTNEQLNWERKYYFSYNGGYSQRTHSLSDIKISAISNPITYSSNYASSNFAMMVYLNVGTLFTYHESQYQSGTNPYYYSSFVDTLGKTTPRRLDIDDFNYGNHILIVDLTTGKSIDFFSVLNFYYASGIEPLPSISYLQ